MEAWDPLPAILGIAVLGPVLRSFLGILKKPTSGYVSGMLCFAAGVMLGISFLELIPESIRVSSTGVCIAGILAGSLLMFSLDLIVPHFHPILCSPEHDRKLEKASLYLILGIFLHNFPEGMAIAAGAAGDTRLSFVIALAIAIHNIPEGICTSAPYYHATGKRWKSFFLSSSTALPILLGFLKGISYETRQIPAPLDFFPVNSDTRSPFPSPSPEGLKRQRTMHLRARGSWGHRFPGRSVLFRTSEFFRIFPPLTPSASPEPGKVAMKESPARGRTKKKVAYIWEDPFRAVFSRKKEGGWRTNFSPPKAIPNLHEPIPPIEREPFSAVWKPVLLKPTNRSPDFGRVLCPRAQPRPNILPGG